ncbi:MAG TPA: hypothetical protein VM240_14855 [Verrucomicrobiae bacterium]|nr:hypothetical protein [Verrucomicrobiae bacterium]
MADDKALLHNGAVEAFLNHVSQRNREVAMQIAGRSVAELNKVVTLLEDWETRLDGDPTYDPACWRAAWAMAQLEHLRPIQGPGERYSFEKLANTLNMQQAMTGFQLSPSDLRKVIAILNRYWCGDSDERADRGRMPEFARQAGFPRVPPTIPGLNANDAPKRLYDSCRTLRITNDLQAHEDAPRCVAHLQVKHLVVEKTHGKNN